MMKSKKRLPQLKAVTSAEKQKQPRRRELARLLLFGVKFLEIHQQSLSFAIRAAWKVTALVHSSGGRSVHLLPGRVKAKGDSFC